MFNFANQFHIFFIKKGILRKIWSLVLLSVFFLVNSYSQQKTLQQEKEVPPAVKQNNLVIEPYYGFPYWWGYILSASYQNSQVSNVRIRNTNHIGGKIEYFVTDYVGIGLDFTYANFSISYSDYNNGNSFIHTYSITKMRFLGRMNFHFATTPFFDPYATLGFGYNRVIYYDSNPSNSYNNNLTLNFIPISFRAGVGCRYFFSNNMGIHAEMGLGGPVGLIGVVMKI